MVDPKQIAKDQLRELLNETTQEYEILINPLKRLSQQIDGIAKAQRDLIKSGGTFFSSYTQNANTFSEAVQNVAKDSLRLFGNAQQGIDAFKSLSMEMKSFVSFNSTMQDQLAKTAMRMNALGFDTNSLAKIIDTAALAFGKSGQELNQLAIDLGGLSRKYMISPKQLADDFSMAQKNFAYTSKAFMQNFEKLQIMSRKTGISFSTMTNAFGDKMDTFSGAAQTAGRLNAILGKSAVNTLDLLGKTEAERAITIREALGGPIDFKKMGKFELKAIADTLGLGSIEDTRRFLQGSVTGTGDNAQLEGGSKDLNKRLDDNAKELSNTFGAFDGSVQNAKIALDEFTSIIKNMRTPAENFQIEAGNELAKLTSELTEAAARKMFEQKGIGGPELDRTMKRFQALDTFTRQRVIQSVATGQLDAREIGAVDPQTFERRFGDTAGARPNISGLQAIKEAKATLESLIKDEKVEPQKVAEAIAKLGGAVTVAKVGTKLGVDPSSVSSLALTLGPQLGKAIADGIIAAVQTPGYSKKLLEALFDQ